MARRTGPSHSREVWLAILSGIGSGFQYFFMFVTLMTIIVYTGDLVAQDKLGGEVFSIIVGGIVTGMFALVSPIGRREEKNNNKGWDGINRRTEKEEVVKEKREGGP